MSDTTTTRRPWFQVADALGGHDTYDRNAQLARWLTYTHANMLAFDEATITGNTRAAVDYLHRAIPAFTAAALTRGETPEWAYEVGVMGDTGEIIWEWLDDLGINPDDIAPATDTEAEKRGAVWALSEIATAYGGERVGDLTVRGNVEMFARSLARAIEAGEITP